MPQPNEAELRDYANSVATELGRTIAVCKIAAEYPQLSQSLYANLSPGHQLLLDCFRQAGGEVGPLLRAS